MTVQPITEFMASLRRQGMQIGTDGERLRLKTTEGALSPTLRQELTARKSEIIAFLLAAQQSRTALVIQPVNRNQPLPLSFAQQRLWILDQMGAGAAYNIPTAIALHGQLDINALERALNEIVARHEALRTTFSVNVDGVPAQRIHPCVTLSLSLIDLTEMPDDEQRIALEGFHEAEAFAIFDLTADLMLRAKLVRLDTDTHVLFITAHHIAFDGWSAMVLIRELTVLYSAFAADHPSPLPPPAMQYADFAAWQRNWQQSGEQKSEDGLFARQLAYWQQQLSGAPPLLQLPTDRPRPAVQRYRGQVVTFPIDKELTQALHQISRQADATLFMTLLAAFQLLLMRYTGQEDIVVGSPIANRTHHQLEPLIGFFANTLALRTDLSGNPTFLELLAQVRQTAQTAYIHQDLPFERLVEALQPVRALDHNPIVQVTFAFQNITRPTLTFDGLQGQMMTFEAQTARMDLELELYEQDGRIVGQWLYNSDLFDKSTIQRMIDHFQTLLTGIVEQPNAPIAALPLLTETEERQILVNWNDTATSYPKDKCFHQLFEEQVERTPDAIAVSMAGEPSVTKDKYPSPNLPSLTYRELNARANQLAHHLRSQGVGPTTLVGICVDRSLEMMVGLLGILKAGGAYVPLDPTYPPARLSFMLEDAGIALLLTQEELRQMLPHTEAQLICLDSDWPQIARQECNNPAALVQSSDLAYLIYTSGSTGQPKGVQITHQSLTNFLCTMTQKPGLLPRDRLLSVTTLSFDIAALELYLPLVVGARIVLVDHLTRLDVCALAEVLIDQQITVMQATPTTWRLLIEGGWQGSRILRILCGGEALAPDLSTQLLTRCHELWNLYGPTETTIWSVIHQVQPDDPEILIGRPIANTQVYILDQQQRPAPIGATGTLYIGGDGVAVGYRNRDELTQERFVANPYGDGTLYNTGDLARYRADGAIECLGRSDQQIKLRGFRIELGEIEAVLAAHPAIHEAAVVVREIQSDDKQLVGYLVADPIDSENASNAIHEWQTLWDESYARAYQPQDLTVNLAGWQSSYSREAIPTAEMEEWIAETVADIRRLQPKRILEIGCGTGLLLARLAPTCSVYRGTDYSEQAIQYVERLKTTFPDLTHVELDQRAADDFTGIAEGHYDCVVLNSVIQYFPNVDYLLTVLDGAVRAVQPGGTIYIGDVRNLRLLQGYHTAVQSAQAPDELPLDQLSKQIGQRLRNEEELLIDPDFFYALRHRFPQISQVEIQLKRGHFCNELTQFRYQVVLYVGEAAADSGQQPVTATPSIGWQEVDWSLNNWTLAALADQLHQQTQSQPEIGLLVHNIPNARVQHVFQTVALLEQVSSGTASLATVAQLRARPPQREGGVDPGALWAFADAFPYTVQVSWSSRPDKIDAYFLPGEKGTTAGPEALAPCSFISPTIANKPWQAYANNPLLGKQSSVLLSKVRSWLHEKLPEYMIPTTFVFLAALPLTPNGKRDRNALASPTFAPELLGMPRGTEHAFAPPRTPTEVALAAIWSNLLDLERVGIHDDFFALGGHSLTAIRVQHQIQNRMGIDLPVEIFFEFRTIASLAPSIDGLFSHTTEALPSADPMALLNGTAQKLPLDGVAAQVDPNQESQEWIETKL